MTPDVYFVNGVRVFYRAYAADHVVEIIEDSTKQCGVYAKNCDVFDYPMRDLKKGIPVDGMTVLASLPTELPKPYPFLKGGREVLDNVLLKVRKEFQSTQPLLAKEWSDWAKNEAPASDNVDEYLLRKPLHVPLGNILFSGLPIDAAPVAEWNNDSIADNIQRMRTTDCVKWSRWNHQREDHCPEDFARVEYGQNAEMERVLVNALPEKVKYYRQWKVRKNIKDDEKGEYKFVLCREDRQNINSALTIEGQVIELANGGHRVYWKNKRKAEDFPVDGEDKSFSSMIDIGWFAYGKVVPPEDGRGRIGVVKLTNADGVPLPQVLAAPQTDNPIIIATANTDVVVTEVVVQRRDENDVAEVENSTQQQEVLQQDLVNDNENVAEVENTQQEAPQDIVSDSEKEMKNCQDVIVKPTHLSSSNTRSKKRKLDHDWYSTSSVVSNNILSGKRSRVSAKKYEV